MHVLRTEWFEIFPGKLTARAAFKRNFPISFFPRGPLLYQMADYGFRRRLTDKKKGESGCYISAGQWAAKDLYNLTGQRSVSVAWAVGLKAFWCWQSPWRVLEPLSACHIRISLPVSASQLELTLPHWSRLVSSRALKPKWSTRTNHTIPWITSGSWSSNKPCWNNRSSSAFVSSLAAWERFPCMTNFQFFVIQIALQTSLVEEDGSYTSPFRVRRLRRARVFKSVAGVCSIIALSLLPGLKYLDRPFKSSSLFSVVFSGRSLSMYCCLSLFLLYVWVLSLFATIRFLPLTPCTGMSLVFYSV